MYCTLLPILNVLVPPQVGAFLPHVVPQVCMCIAHVCGGGGGGGGGGGM